MRGPYLIALQEKLLLGNVDLLLDASGFPGAFAHVVELGATDVASALDLDIGDAWAVGLKYALHAFTIRDLAHGKG